MDFVSCFDFEVDIVIAMPSPAGHGVGFVGLSIAAIAALMTFSLHKIEEGSFLDAFFSSVLFTGDAYNYVCLLCCTTC